MTIYNASLLKLAREQNGFTQAELAAKLGVKQAVLSKYEHGTIVPADSVQLRLSEILDYPKSFFFKNIDEIPSGLVFHRKRSSLTASVRLKVEAEVRARALDVIKLFRENGIRSNLLSRGNRSPEQMARDLRSFWNVPAGPIQNLTSLLEKNNIVVLKFDFGTDRLDGFFMPLPEDVILIALNSNAAFSADRQRHTQAHELGHALLHTGEFPEKDCEKEAESFAAEFLAPKEDILNDLYVPLTLARLKELKTKWKMSMGSLVYRAHSLNAINQSTYRRTWMYLSSIGFRRREPDCGIVEERPALLSHLVESFAQTNPAVLEELNITTGRFLERYPELRGLIMTTVTAS